MSEQFLLVCVRCSQARRGDASAAGEQVDPASEGMPVAAPLLAFHPHQRRASDFPAGPTVRRPALPGKAACQQIFQKERPQGFDRFGGNAAKKRLSVEAEGKLARPNRAIKADSKGMHGFVERLQGPLAADGIAEEHGQKIKDVVASEASSRKTHALTDLVEDPCFCRWDATRATSPNHDGVAGCVSAEVWIQTDPSAILLISASLKGCNWFFPFKEAHFSAYLLQRCELIAHVVGKVTLPGRCPRSISERRDSRSSAFNTPWVLKLHHDGPQFLQRHRLAHNRQPAQEPLFEPREPDPLFIQHVTQRPKCDLKHKMAASAKNCDFW